MSRPATQATLLALCLMTATWALFWPVVNHGFFIVDDSDYVLDNAHVLSGLTWENFRWAFSAFYAANWHPLTWISHMADVQLFGMTPRGHHLTSVVLHGVNGGLLCLLLARMTGSLWRSVLVAALFALHPLRAESVAWVAE